MIHNAKFEITFHFVRDTQRANTHDTAVLTNRPCGDTNKFHDTHPILRAPLFLYL
jgi:hypothetical protein